MSKEWQHSSASSQPDPLSAYLDQPMIAHPGPNSRYVGRVIVELYENGSEKSDASKIAYTVDAIEGNYDTLALRIAKALVARLSQKQTSS